MTPSQSAQIAPISSQERRHWNRLYAAWVISLVSSLSVLFVGEVLGQPPCTLCWYQRAMMFPLTVIMAIACYRAATGIWIYALPLAVIGWLFALYHSLLFAGAIPEPIKVCGAASCTDGTSNTLGGIPMPYMSLLAFSAITGLLYPFRMRLPK
jgi:disulfide bond formation protein DsbB